MPLPPAAGRQCRSRSPQGGRCSRSLDSWINAVHEDWTELADAPWAVRAEPEVVAEAMRVSRGEALRLAAPGLQRDAEFLHGAAAELGAAAVLQHVAEELRSNVEFLLAVSEEVGAEVLQHASATLLGNRAAISRLLSRLPREQVLPYASEAVRKELLGGISSPESSARQQQPCRAVAKEAPAVASLGKQIDRAATLKAVRNLLETKSVLEEESVAAASAAHREAPAESLPFALENKPAADPSQGGCAARWSATQPTTAGQLPPAARELQEGVLANRSSDRSVVLTAVKLHGVAALKDADVFLRGDLGFMMEVSAFCPLGEAMLFATEELRSMLDDTTATPMD
eukprot:TRINITY_DN44651_c0_g2_i3.p1 TRINITY_DN44651_c0_g2~~TRINITY_DN44651_c0_g2_i3.p1  ORF type:complete len:343 (+),score=114.74 TRINITY_DN44651_c0_g2_i3:147-1175(+)